MEDYNPFEYTHNVMLSARMNSDLGTLLLFCKGSLAAGIFAMPLAYSQVGLLAGLIGTFFLGILCMHGMHILVKSSQKLCDKTKVEWLSYAKTAETAFLFGPEKAHRFANSASFIVNLFIVLYSTGCCVVYIICVSANIKQIVRIYGGPNISMKMMRLILLPFLLIFNMKRQFKYLALAVNMLILYVFILVFYYLFRDMPSVHDRLYVDTEIPWAWAYFFGTSMFALEAIGLVMLLEKNIKKRKDYIEWCGACGILDFGMVFVILSYSSMGFFGYLKYGDANLRGNITLSIPTDGILALTVKIANATAIFFTYNLQFFVSNRIIWNSVKDTITPELQTMAEYSIRVALILITFVISLGFSNIGSIIAFIGSVFLTVLGFLFPGLIETFSDWNDPGLGKFYWKLWKNICFVTFGCLGIVLGSIASAIIGGRLPTLQDV